jgi:hypothetical protein
MADKLDLDTWVREAIHEQGNRASLVAVAQHIWANHEVDLRSSGDLFFTWQYDMRWAANRLRRRGIMKPVEMSPSGVWELTKS